MKDIEKSKSIRTGLQRGFRDGTSKMAQRKCYGYDTSLYGELVINPDEATVVRWIFDRYLSGDSLGKISAGLEEQGIPSPMGKPRWNWEALNKLLSNEKYVGEVRMQKTFTADFLTGRREKNTGQLDAYLVENAHEPIIDRKTFELVQRIKRTHNRSKECPANIKLC